MDKKSSLGAARGILKWFLKLEIQNILYKVKNSLPEPRHESTPFWFHVLNFYTLVS